MSRIVRFRLAALIVGAAAALTAYHRSTEQAMVDAAQNWLASLTPEQMSKATFEFTDAKRETWHFVPGNNYEQTYKFPRHGLTYGQMQPEQRHLADALLAASLSQNGFIKAKTVMSLEEVLRIKEGDLTGRRDPYRYHFSMFGKPSADGAWGWRVEGHHISLHFTLKGGKLISTTPTFYGANPHLTDISPRKGLRPLGGEEDTARKLMKSLSAQQRNKALIADEAYKDILTAADTRAKLDNQPAGLPASEMSAEQYQALLAVIEEYASNVPAEVAAARMKEAKNTAKDQLFFAWAGSIEPGRGDYYRVRAPTFLIEYDNTQNENNHSHTVWRDYDGDFGRDLLALHHRLFDHRLGVRAAD